MALVGSTYFTKDKMHFHYWIDPSRDRYAYFLGGVDHAPLSSLWILPEEKVFDAEIMKAIVESFPEHGCALWRLNSYAKLPSTKPPTNVEEYRAFAHYPELINGFLARSELKYSTLVKQFDFRFAETVYGDIGWFSIGQWDLLAKFVSESVFGTDS